MILSSLCEYYSYMKKKGLVLCEGYSGLSVNFLVCLNEDGTLEDILSLAEGEGKTAIYPTKIFPERTQKSAIASNIVEHRPLYLFGLSATRDGLTADDEKARKSHEAFVKANSAFFRDLTDPLCAAFLKFVENWNPVAEAENPCLLAIRKEYATARFAFCLSGRVNEQLQDEPQVREKWERIYSGRNAEDDQTAICPIYGKELRVAPLHNKIKGIVGGQPSGCILVCFNNPSENSYGKKQSYNSSISERAMREYTEALNYLLSEKTHHTRIDDMTVVHFALSERGEACERFIAESLFSSSEEPKRTDPGDLEEGLKASLTNLSAGRDVQLDAYDTVDEDTKYCIFGLVPNASRLAVRFSYVNTFGHFRRMYEKYADDFRLEGMERIPSVWRIRKELISPKSGNESLPPEYGEQLLRTVLNGTPLPHGIAERLIRRIKTDSDTDRERSVRMNHTRIGLLKVYLNRTVKNEKEKITMSLNRENSNPAYLCGRLFAVLEKVQQDASGGTLNKTIKDSYFSSACATPSLVFPRLMKLSNAHLAKLPVNTAVFYQKLMGEIIDGLEEFPGNLSLNAQGNFIVGYYQQNKNLYTKKEIATEEH